jgi:site-specific DNA-methyltransferase (adenine-specific)
MKQLALVEMSERSLPIMGNEPAFRPVVEGFQVQFEHPHGCLYQGDSIQWLASLESSSVDLIFADPPYNIKKADWDTFESQQE